MKIRVLGAGFYGCHIARSLMNDHDVEVHEVSDHIFAGASGAIPARLHLGFHYPRSRMTRAACLEHQAEFMAEYGFLTRSVPVNIYAIAAERSMVDFDQYVQTLKGEVEFITIEPQEFGLQNCEGAVLTGERHIVTDWARAYFTSVLGERARLSRSRHDGEEFDWTIDCTFAANSASGVDRYEPCLVLQLEGKTDKAVTIMDGPFGSLYPWNEELGLCSLSSAKFSPFSKSCKTWAEANAIKDSLTAEDVKTQGRAMIDDMAGFYPAVRDYKRRGDMLSVRAMPASGADTRLVDVRRSGLKEITVRAGKIDAIIHAEKRVRAILCSG